VTSLDNDKLALLLGERGIASSVDGDHLRVACAPVDVGRVAAENSIVLTELRSGAAGLEDLFLELTSESQRDVLTEGAPA
jgi:ABC-2 type transport system ATP-binding protein